MKAWQLGPPLVLVFVVETEGAAYRQKQTERHYLQSCDKDNYDV